MKKLLAAVLLLPLVAQAAGNDLLINQRRADDAATLTRGVSPPSGGGVNAIMGYSGASNLPAFFGIGPGLLLSSGQISGFSGAYGDLSGTPLVFAPAAHTQPWSTITATPTTVAGYGIADAATLTQLATKLTIPAGTTAQYVRGDGSLASLPTAKRIESYVGVTDANGLFTVTYPTAFSAVPSVQPGPPSDSTQSWVLVTSTTTGFSVRLVQRSVLTVLSLQVLAGVVSNVAAASAQVLVVAQ